MLFNILLENSLLETILEILELVSLGIEILAVIYIVYSVLFNFIRHVNNSFKHIPEELRYQQFKHGLARSLLLGLEILIAADIARTVALEQSLESISVLGLLVLIRTFLSWSLVVEFEGRWPWHPKS